MESAVPGDLCFSFTFESFSYSFCHYHVSWWKVERKKKKVKKIDDLPVLATCQFGTSVMFPSKVNGPVAHTSTR